MKKPTLNIYTFEKGKKEPTLIAHTWREICELGWQFTYLSLENHVVMTRSGYINEFWQEEVK